VTIYAVGSADDVNYIATEYVEGETVRELINRGVDLKANAFRYLANVRALSCRAQSWHHHRDIKPENIMIRRRFRKSS
jgi:serine/threonine protein kinase